MASTTTLFFSKTNKGFISNCWILLFGSITKSESFFKLFKSKLNSYWSGDIADIKTRFSEQTLGDSNWEAMKYLTEKEGTQADKAAFYLANIARAANDNKFLTYSTKIMAATDDAFWPTAT